MERSIRRELCSWSRSFTKRSFCWEKGESSDSCTSVKQWGRQTWMSSVCVYLLNILYTEFESRKRRDVEIKEWCVSQKCQKGDVLFSMHVQNTNWAARIYLQVGKLVWHFLVLYFVLYDLCWIEEKTWIQKLIGIYIRLFNKNILPFLKTTLFIHIHIHGWSICRSCTAGARDHTTHPLINGQRCST